MSYSNATSRTTHHIHFHSGKDMKLIANTFRSLRHELKILQRIAGRSELFGSLLVLSVTLGLADQLAADTHRVDKRVNSFLEHFSSETEGDVRQRIVCNHKYWFNWVRNKTYPAHEFRGNKKTRDLTFIFCYFTGKKFRLLCCDFTRKTNSFIALKIFFFPRLTFIRDWSEADSSIVLFVTVQVVNPVFIHNKSVSNGVAQPAQVVWTVSVSQHHFPALAQKVALHEQLKGWTDSSHFRGKTTH